MLHRVSLFFFPSSALTGTNEIIISFPPLHSPLLPVTGNILLFPFGIPPLVCHLAPIDLSSPKRPSSSPRSPFSLNQPSPLSSEREIIPTTVNRNSQPRIAKVIRRKEANLHSPDADDTSHRIFRSNYLLLNRKTEIKHQVSSLARRDRLRRLVAHSIIFALPPGRPAIQSHNVRCDNATACIQNLPSLLFVFFLVPTSRTAKHHVFPRYSVDPSVQADVGHRIIPVYVREGQRFGNLR